MSNKRMSKAQRKAAREGLSKFLSVLLSLAMVLQTSPVAYARWDEGADVVPQEEYVAEEAVPAEEQAAPEEAAPEEGGEEYVPEEYVPEEVVPAEEAPAPEQAQPESVATLTRDDESRVEALRVEGPAATDRDLAAQTIFEQTELDDVASADAALQLFPMDDETPTEPDDIIGPVADDEYERSLDGSNIERISARWVTPDTDPDNGRNTRLYVRPADDEEQTVVLGVNYALSGEFNYAPGTVTITIPAYIFKDANGKDYGTITIPFPEEPKDNKDFNWRRVGDEYVLTNTKYFEAATTGYFEISWSEMIPHELVDMQESAPFQARIMVTTNKDNTIALKSNQLTAQFDTEAKVKDLTKRVSGSAQRVEASQIPEEQRVEGEKEYILVNWYLWGVTEANTVYTLDLLDSIPQDQVVGNTSKKDGATEADAGGFIVKRSLGSGATLSEQDTVLENKGIYKGYMDGRGQYYYYTTAYPASQFKPDTLYTFHNNVKYTVTERDPEVTNPVNPNLKGGEPDPQLVTTYKASASTTYSWSEPEWVDPPGHFYIIKNGNDDKEQHGQATRNLTRRADRYDGRPISDMHIWYNQSPIHGWYGLYPSGINDLQDLYEEQGAEGSIRLSYTVDSIGYAMPWFFDSTSFERDGAVASRMSKNYNLPVTITTYDEGLSIGRSKEDAEGNNIGMLSVGTDYEFVSVEFPEAPYVYTGQPQNINPDGSWRAVTAGDGTFKYTRDYDRSQWPDFNLEVQRGGAWEHLATASWKSGKLQVTLADGTTQDSAVVDLPEGTENWRTIVTLHNTSTDEEANQALQAAIDYDVRVVVDFKSTDAVKALIDELFSQTNTPSMQVWNKAELVATDSDGEYIISPNELDDDGYDRVDGYTTDTMVYPTKTAKYTSKDVNYDEGYVTVHYTAKVEEQSLIHDKVAYEQAVADGRLVTETQGVWYDLLPKGMVPDLDSVKLRDGDNITYKGIVSDNYKGTGRILMVVRADLAPQTVQVRTGDTYTYEDVPTLTFDARMTFEAINDYGKTVHNVVAFESGNDTIGTIPKYSGEPDDPRYVEEGQTDAQGNPVGGNIATSRAFADDAERDAFTDLDADRDTPSFVYAGTYTTLNLLAQARTSLSKEVSVNGDGYWNTGTYYMDEGETLDDVLEAPEGNKRTVYEGGQYAYRLRMTSDASTISSNLVLYDSLEDFYVGSYTGGEPNDEIDRDAPHWHGTLISVDTSQLESKGCAPVIYYTTYSNGDRRLQLSDESDKTQVVEIESATNLENSEVWVRRDQYTGDLADVTGVAIDCRKKADGTDFQLQPLESVTAILRMQAPSGEEARKICANDGAWGKSAQAYNNCFLKCDQTDTETGRTDPGKFIRKDYTKVGMVEYGHEVEKRWDDDSNRDGIRPESVTVNLLRDGKPALDDDGNPIKATVTPDEKGNWNYTFEHLPRTDPNGYVYEYSATEEPVEGYTSTSTVVDGKTTITNKHTPETTRVDGKKLWSGDTEGARPASVTVRLLADGAFKQSQTVTPDKDGNWSYSFEGLLKYRDKGTEIAYTVEELVTDTAGRSYTNKVTGSAAEGYTITNTYHPYGELFVSKAVKDVTDVSKEQEFTFTFEFTRTVDGEEQPVTAEYAYDVLDEDDQVVSSGTVASNGTITIKGGQTIHVKEMDEYIQYKVSEADEAGFTLTSSQGTTGTIKPNETSKASMTNTYEATGRLTPAIVKTVGNKNPRRRDFTFSLYRIDGGEETFVGKGYSEKASETVEREDGTLESATAPVRFASLEYTQADAGKTYSYVVREDIPAEATNEAGKDYGTYHGTIGVSGPWTYKGVTYDESEFLMDVSIVDNGDGTLTVTPTYKKNGPLFFDETVEQVEFKNEYKASGEVELKAWKDLQGRKVTEGEFTFELLGDEVDEKTGASKVLQTKTNDASGTVTFDKIEYDETDIGKTFHYYVREVAGNDPTVTYDENVYGYSVIVYDDGDGNLSTSSTRCGVKVTEVPVEGEFSFRTIEVDGTVRDWNNIPAMVRVFHDSELGNGRYWSRYRVNNSSTIAQFNRIWGEAVDGVYVRANTFGSDDDVQDAMERAYRYLWKTSTASLQVGDVLVYDSGYTDGFSGYIPRSTYHNDGGHYYHTWFISVEQAYKYLYEPEGMTENEPAVFTNELRPGGFTVTKLVTDAEGADPNQEFKFKVVLSGDVSDETVTGYTLSEVEASDQTTMGTMSESDEADEGLLGKLGDLLTGPDADVAASLAKLNPFAPTKAFAAEGGTFNGMDWEITDDGTLILGKESEAQTLTMPINTYYNEKIYPWKSYSALIKSARFAGDVKAIGDLNYMFSSMDALESVDLTGFDTTDVTAMNAMFLKSGKLESVDLSGLDLTSCDGIAAMFQGTSSLKSVDMSGISAPRLNGVGGMFTDSSVVSIDMSGFDAPALGSTAGMFYKAHNLESIDMSGFHAPSVSSMGSMFYECKSLKSLDLSSFEIHLANTGMYRDFYNCSALESLDISGIDTTNATYLTEVFEGCSSLSEVTLGTKFSFKGNGSVSINSSKLPDSPVEDPYTGKWIKLDGSSEALTAEDLADEYDSSYAGTWVWASHTYKVSFDANGGAGSMPNRLYLIDRDAQLPTNQFKRFGYNFTGWNDADGNVYEPNGTIPANTFAKDQEVTLTAQWEPVDTSVTMNNGEFEFTLHGNERATFDNIPAGVSYAVYEETPDGWVLVEQSNVSGTIPAADYADATFTNKYQPGTTSAQFNGVKQLDGVAAEAGAYTFELLENGEVIQKKQTLDGGFVQFDTITYEKKDVGTHTYTVREVDPQDSSIDYDRHVETVTVEVTDDGHGNLSSKVTYDEDGIRFSNKTRPGELRLSKVAEGLTDANKDDVFTFEIELTNEKGMPLGANDQVYWYVEGAAADSGDGADNGTADAQQPQDAQAPKASSLIPRGGLLSAGARALAGLFAPTKALAAESDVRAWYPWGDCQWGIDRDGCLWIRPIRGAAVGTLGKPTGNSPGTSPWYASRNSIKSVRVPEGKKVKLYQDSSNLFYGCSRLTSIDLSSFDASGVTSEWGMRSMFQGCSSLASIDLSVLDTSNVKSMYRMFDGCSSLASIDLSVLDTSNVKSMYGMFQDCRSLAEVNLSGLNTSSLENMQFMFRNCASLRTADLSGLDTSNVTDTSYLFQNCSSLTSVNLSGLDLSSVTDMNYMFQKCTSLTSIDMSGLDVSSVKGMNSMFDNCTSLTSADLSDLDASSVTDMSFMFRGCKSLTSANLSGLDASSVTGMGFMFEGCSRLQALDLSDFKTSQPRYLAYMFQSCSALSTLDLSSLDTSSVTNMYNMFGYMYNLSEVTLGPKFTFRGDGGENPKYSSLPDASNSSPYTGKWVKVDDPTLALTALELAEDYDASYAGTWVWESANGRVFYKPNGGVTTAETAVVKEAGESVTIPDGTTTKRPHYKLTGWNTAADGSGTSYEPGGSYTDIVELGENLVLYAQWEQTDERDYTVRHYQQPVSLSADHADYVLAETEVLQADKGTEVTPETKEYEGFVAPEKLTVTVADDDSTVVEYYYDLVTSDVSFDGHGATSGYTDGQKLVGAVAAKLNANGFSKTGSLFTGWNTAADGSGTGYTDGQQVKASDLVTEPGATVTLYAQWMDNPNEPLTPTAGKITVTCKAGETIVLPDLPAGTKYTITEVGLPGGWSQSGDVANGSGTIAPNRAAEATARNTYSARGTVQLEAHKALEGGELKEGMFEFELVNENGTVLQTKSNDAVDTAEAIVGADGESTPNPWVGTAPVYFDAFQIDESWIGQTHTYTIREKVVSSDKTVTYDTDEETVTVEFYDAGHGQMAATVTYDDDGALFTNTTNTTGLKIEKTIEAPDSLASTKFDFTVTLKGADGSELVGDYPMVVTRAAGVEESTIKSGGTVSLAGGETAEISGLPIGGSYEVTEAKAEGWEATSTVASGKLEAEKTAVAKFNNKWDETQPAKGTAKIVAHKRFEGGTIAEDEFTFQLLDSNGSVIQQKSVDKAGGSEADVTFDPITYTSADANKTFQYRVREVAGSDETITYDASNFDVWVSVGPDTGNGALATDVRYVKFNAEGTVQESTTEASDESGELKVEAMLVGDVPESGFAAGDTVSFLVTVTNTGTEAEGYELRGVKATDTLGDLNYQANALAAGKSIQFGVDHVVTGADVVSGKVSDTIKVEATGRNGKLACEAALSVGTETWSEATESPATFVNVANERTRVEGVKVWNDGGNAGRTRPSSVTVKLLADGFVKETTTTSAAEGWAWSFENLPLKNANGTEIVYGIAEVKAKDYATSISQADDGTWTITNTQLTDVDITKEWNDSDNEDGMRPTAEEFAAKVHLLRGAEEVKDVTPTVTDNGDGTYTVTWADLPAYDVDGNKISYTATEDAVKGYDSDAQGAVEAGDTITNTRKTPTPTSGTIEVTKTLVGRDWADGDEFTFKVEANKSNPTNAMPVERSVTVTKADAGHTKSFGEISFTKAGNYTYTVTEAKGSLPGVAYDTNGHTVTFEVEETEAGTLVAKEGTTLAQTVSVENTFAPATATIEVTKSINYWGDGDTFAFTLAGVGEAPMPDEAGRTATATKDAAVAKFGAITYGAPGTYEYTITEIDGGLPGVTYDTTPHAVTVTVEPDPETNVLTAKVSYKGQDGATASSLTVTNGRASASARIQVTKALSGRDWADSDRFEFALAPVGGAPMPASATAAATREAPTATFGDIVYAAPGTYEYTLTEVKGSLANVTYDTKPHKVVVTVKADKATGSLTTAVTYDGKSSLTVTNTYKPETKKPASKKALAKTGDPYSGALAAGLAAGGLLALAFGLRRRRREEDVA